MTPEQRARFNAGTPAVLPRYEASNMAHDCILIGISTGNRALLETAEDLSRHLRNAAESCLADIDPLEQDSLYACIVAATDATMCVLPLNHPARCRQPHEAEPESIPATTQPQMHAPQPQASPERPPRRRVGYPALAGLFVRRPRQHASAAMQ